MLTTKIEKEYLDLVYTYRCQNCGIDVQIEDIYCRKCGYKFVKTITIKMY